MTLEEELDELFKPYIRHQRRQKIKSKKVRTCTRKIAYLTELEALEATKRLKHKAYNCPYCRQWHTTKG